MINARKEGHGAIKVADPNLGGAGVEIERPFFVDLGGGMEGERTSAQISGARSNRVS
jgi:hypothetical protein